MGLFLPNSHSHNNSGAQSFSQLNQFLEDRVLEGGHATHHHSTHRSSSTHSLCTTKPQCSGDTACVFVCSCVSCKVLIPLAIFLPLIIAIGIPLIMYYIRRRKRAKGQLQFRPTESIIPTDFLEVNQKQNPHVGTPWSDKEPAPFTPMLKKFNLTIHIKSHLL